MFSSSFRQGITTDRSVDAFSSAASASEDLLFCAVLMVSSSSAHLQVRLCGDSFSRPEKQRTEISKRHAFRFEILPDTAEAP